MKNFPDLMLVAIAGTMSLLGSAAYGQPIIDFSNFYIANDRLDPNDPNDIGPYVTDPLTITGYILSTGASGPTVTNVEQDWFLASEGEFGSLFISNSTKTESEGSQQTPLLILPDAGSADTGSPLLVLRDNSVGIGGFGAAPLHIFGTYGDGEPRIVLDTGVGSWT